MWRCIQTCPKAVMLQDAGNHGRSGPLAVGSRDVHKALATLRVSKRGGERTHTRQVELGSDLQLIPECIEKLNRIGIAHDVLLALVLESSGRISSKTSRATILFPAPLG